jgi:hypothetical protein
MFARVVDNSGFRQKCQEAPLTTYAPKALRRIMSFHVIGPNAYSGDADQRSGMMPISIRR